MHFELVFKTGHPAGLLAQGSTGDSGMLHRGALASKVGREVCVITLQKEIGKTNSNTFLSA